MVFMTRVLAEGESSSLIAPPWVFGVIALAIFATLCFVVWTYRDVANRHRKADPEATSHAGAPGASSHGAGH